MFAPAASKRLLRIAVLAVVSCALLVLAGSASAMTIVCSTDPCNGTSGADDIFGTENTETINGLSGRDNIQARAGGDMIHGGTYGDTLYGMKGSDYIYGEDGDDTLYAGCGNDFPCGSGIFNYLNGGAGDDILAAEDGNATEVHGGQGWDICYIDAPDTNVDGCEDKR
jgi:Ca2+-binding RTX toxin-like protein